MANSNFIVRGGADFSGIQSEMTRLQGQFRGFQAMVSGGLKLAGISLGIGALVNFGKKAVEVASDLVEVQNVVDVTFGNMAGHVNDFSKTALTQFGLSELSAKKYTSTMGAMLKSSGFGVKSATDMSIEISKLTADMASFYNLDTDTAFDKIRSGLSGQTEPLKQLGINMNIANLQAYAMSQGITRAYKNMSQAEQTLLRYNYLLNVSADSHGDFARNSGTWANQVKILSERWKEFSALIGKALMEFLLPVVKFLNKVLEVLIAVTKEIGKIYTMITGKQVKVEATASEAADGEEDLAKGIDKAAKAAKKALAPFDELNILQNNMKDGGGSGGSLGNAGKSETNTNITTTAVDDGFDKTKGKAEKFFAWFTDKWNALRQMLSVPILVPAPIFASIPNPIYNPNWGLTPPLVPMPSFNPIPSPVYNPNWGLEVPRVAQPVFQPIPSLIYKPNWGLELPKIPVPIFPAIEYGAYNRSLEAIKTASVKNSRELEIENNRVTKNIVEGLSTAWGKIEANYNTHKAKFGAISVGISKDWETENGSISNKITEGLTKTWGAIETNYNKHKSNIGTIALGISTVLVENINQGLSKVGTNINNTITTTQTNLQTWGKNIGGIAIESAKGLANNISEGLKVTAQNTVSFANGHLSNMKSWGSGVLSVAGETARGFASNMASGFSSTWNSFKSLMSGMGEKVSGWFSENKSMVIKTTIVAGAVVGAGALALAVPAAIPYMAGALGGLSAIPALEKGGITNGEMIAMIGDNPGGREVVSPLDDLLGMITTAVSSTSNNSSGDTTIIVKIGEDTITEKVVSNINRQSRISGKTIITV